METCIDNKRWHTLYTTSKEKETIFLDNVFKRRRNDENWWTHCYNFESKPRIFD